MPLRHLTPQPLWNHFARICAIPHGSGNEAGLRAAVAALAGRCGLAHEIDAAGNLLVRKPAAAGLSDRPAVVVQAHLDMVCEKHADGGHDFLADSLDLRIDQKRWVTAEGTTLGADNGIGVAAMMALMEDRRLAHGPLELLFTVAEETGMHGARQLEPGWLAGRYLINLDAERDDTFIVGCAGSRCTTLSLPLDTVPPPADAATAVIRVTGLLGGHSGMDIHRGRANPIGLMARLLQAIGDGLGLTLADLGAGRSFNALAREARATVCYPVGRWHDLGAAVAAWEKIFRAEYAATDAGLRLDLAAVERDAALALFTPQSQRRCLDLLAILPHGVLAMSAADAALVETSTNLAAMETRDGTLAIATKQRSLIDTRLAAAAGIVAAAGRLAGAAITVSGAYPPWPPRAGTRLLRLAARTYETLFDRPPKVRAMHAGLECGLISAAYPHLEIVAIGPNIFDPHSPDERVEIASVEKFWRYLTLFLSALSAR